MIIKNIVTEQFYINRRLADLKALIDLIIKAIQKNLRHTVISSIVINRGV